MLVPLSHVTPEVRLESLDDGGVTFAWPNSPMKWVGNKVVVVPTCNEGMPPGKPWEADRPQ